MSQLRLHRQGQWRSGGGSLKGRLVRVYVADTWAGGAAGGPSSAVGRGLVESCSRSGGCRLSHWGRTGLQGAPLRIRAGMGVLDYPHLRIFPFVLKNASCCFLTKYSNKTFSLQRM